MRKSILALVLSFSLLTAFSQDKRIEGLDSFINRLLKDYKAAGLAIAIVEKNKIVLLKGYGYRDLEKKIPVNDKVLDTYFEKRARDAEGTTLHPTMRTELLNFVDGKRSYFDIYKAVKAEALAAGSWYYGTVKLEDVIKVLDANIKSGAMTLR